MYRTDGVEPPEDELRRLVQPVLDRYRAEWDGVWTDDDYGPGLVVGVSASMLVRRRCVGDLFDLGQDLSDLLGAYSGAGELTARSVVDLAGAAAQPSSSDSARVLGSTSRRSHILSRPSRKGLRSQRTSRRF